MRKSVSVKLLKAFFVSSLFATQALALDASLPAYEPAKLSTSVLTSVGSDSMDALMQSWVGQYNKVQPEVKISITSQGSASAPAALIDGSANFGPMARPMKEPEAEEFLLKYGFQPTEVRSALATVVVYVNKENPISEISLTELDRIFSSSQLRSKSTQAKSWKEIGASSSLANEPIMALSQVPDTFEYAFFKQSVMLQDEFHKGVSKVANLDSLLKTIAVNKNAIGFGTLGGANKNVKMLSVKREAGDKAVLPTMKEITESNYPLSRYLSIYLVREPGEKLEEGVKDFLQFVLSKEGQTVVEKNGLTALPKAVLTEERAKLE